MTVLRSERIGRSRIVAARRLQLPIRQQRGQAQPANRKTGVGEEVSTRLFADKEFFHHRFNPDQQLRYTVGFESGLG